MPDFSHTPGPWEMIINDSGGKDSGLPLCIHSASDDPYADGTPIIGYRTGLIPHDYDDSKPTGEEIIANARLIVYAPVMFDYLYELASKGDATAQKIILGICQPSETMQVRFVGTI